MHQDFGNCYELILWKLKRIISHEGLHIASHPNYKVSWYNVNVEWGIGETITKSCTIIIEVNTVICALYVDYVQGKWE